MLLDVTDGASVDAAFTQIATGNAAVDAISGIPEYKVCAGKLREAG